MNVFYRSPDIAVLSIIVTALAAAAILASTLGARLLRSFKSEERDDAAFDAYIADSDIALPRFYRIVTGGFITLGLMMAFATRPSLTRFVGLGSAAAGIGLLLAFVILMDQPFEAQNGVSSAPIQKVTKFNSKRL